MRRETARWSNKKSTKEHTNARTLYRERSCIRNSRRNVAVRIDDYDDITLIWLLCIIRGITLAKDSPKKGVSREGMTSSCVRGAVGDDVKGRPW